MRKCRKILSAFLCALFLFTCHSPALTSAALNGDVNGDSKITAQDARIILRMCVGAESADNCIRAAADVDCDGHIGANDARLALRLATGCTDYPGIKRSFNAEIIGYTEKGYVVYKENGLTYVDGILIANKTYALPESYNPGDILPECTQAFNEMKRTAASLGLNIYISSGFRSYASQKSIYNRYVARDGKSLADTYSARPGHSEHQTGLSIDLNTITQAFGRTREGRWVAEHCHEYGFIIRYPQGKSHITGYCYEPWHLRYVGVETATKIAQSGLCLEEYFGITSCYN